MWLLFSAVARADCPDVEWSTPAEAQVLVDALQGAVAESLDAAQSLEDTARAASCDSGVTTYEEGACAPIADVAVVLDTFTCDPDADGVGADGAVQDTRYPDSFACGDGVAASTTRRSLLLWTLDSGAAVQSVQIEGVETLDSFFGYPAAAQTYDLTIVWSGAETWTMEYSGTQSDDGVTIRDQSTATWTDCDTQLTSQDYEDPTYDSARWTLTTPAHTLSLLRESDPDPFCALRCGCAPADAVVTMTLDGTSSLLRAADLAPATDLDGDGALAEGSDCNDADPNINPCADDNTCDGLDSDCDGAVDEDTPTGFLDLDGDGYGAGAALSRCDTTLAWSSRGDDCDDADPALHPDAAEACDGLDTDCDGVDEGPGWTDQDGDGYAGTWDIGDCATLFAVAEDCDDTSRSVSPGAVERCNGVDDDCDGRVDSADAPVEGTTRWHPDRDDDGAGATEEVWLCGPAEGHVRNADDCDDTDPNRFPGATEVCDAVDNDCDAAVDEDAVCGDDSGLVTAPPREDGAKGGAGCATTPGSAMSLWAGLFLLSRVRGRRARARGTES